MLVEQEQIAAVTESRDDAARPGIEIIGLQEGARAGVDEVEACAAQLGRGACGSTCTQDRRPALPGRFECLPGRIDARDDGAEPASSALDSPVPQYRSSTRLPVRSARAWRTGDGRPRCPASASVRRRWRSSHARRLCSVGSIRRAARSRRRRRARARAPSPRRASRGTRPRSPRPRARRAARPAFACGPRQHLLAVREVLEGARFDDSGRDRVHANAARRELDCEVAHDGLERGLRGSDEDVVLEDAWSPRDDTATIVEPRAMSAPPRARVTGRHASWCRASSPNACPRSRAPDV